MKGLTFLEDFGSHFEQLADFEVFGLSVVEVLAVVVFFGGVFLVLVGFFFLRVIPVLLEALGMVELDRGVVLVEVGGVFSFVSVWVLVGDDFLFVWDRKVGSVLVLIVLRVFFIEILLFFVLLIIPYFCLSLSLSTQIRSLRNIIFLLNMLILFHRMCFLFLLIQIHISCRRWLNLRINR